MSEQRRPWKRLRLSYLGASEDYSRTLASSSTEDLEAVGMLIARELRRRQDPWLAGPHRVREQKD